MPPDVLPSEHQPENCRTEKDSLTDDSEREGGSDRNGYIKCIGEDQEREVNWNRVPQSVDKEKRPKTVGYQKSAPGEKFREEDERNNHGEVLFRDKGAGSHENYQDDEGELREIPKVVEPLLSEGDVSADHGDERKIAEDRKKRKRPQIEWNRVVNCESARGYSLKNDRGREPGHRPIEQV